MTYIPSIEDPGWLCQACYKIRPEGKAKPQAKRVRTSDAHNDIENAFKMWRIANNSVPDDVFAEEEQAAIETQDRVKAWLAQVGRDAQRLHKAMLACQALDEANDDADVREATRLARLALEAE